MSSIPSQGTKISCAMQQKTNKNPSYLLLPWGISKTCSHSLLVFSRRTETQLPTVVGNWLDNRLFIAFLSLLISLPTSILVFLLCDYFLKQQLLGLKCSSQDLLLGTPKRGQEHWSSAPKFILTKFGRILVCILGSLLSFKIKWNLWKTSCIFYNFWCW